MSGRGVVPLFSQVVKGIRTAEPQDIETDNPTTNLAVRSCSLRRGEKKNYSQEIPLGQFQAPHQAQVHPEPTIVPSENSLMPRRHSRHTCRRSAVDKLRKENDDIHKEKGKAENPHLSKVTSDEQSRITQQSQETNEADDLLKQNKELSQDLFMLKNLVIRLNMELENVQDKLREYLMGDKSTDELSESSRILAAKQPAWGRSDMNAVAPLLQAYQEAIEDKDMLIRNFREEINKFSGHCKKVVNDNIGLLKQLSEEKKKCESMHTEWEAMHKEVITTKEQNGLLFRQSKLYQNSIIQLQNSFRKHLMEMNMTKEQTEERLLKSQMELYALRGKFSILTEECDNLKSDANQKIPVSVHRAAVNECKRLFEELKMRYEAERDTLIRKMAYLSAFTAQPDADIQLVNITTERDELETQNKTCMKEMKKLEEENKKLEAKLKQSERNRENGKRQLAQVMGFAKELIGEQESLLVHFSEKQVANQLRSDMTTRIGHLQNRLKSVERGACRELEGMEQKFKEHASGMGRMKEHFHKEICRLEKLLDEKDSLINKLREEKHQLKEEKRLNQDTREKYGKSYKPLASKWASAPLLLDQANSDAVYQEVEEAHHG